MDARDRSFAAIALRLQLLSREQIHACAAQAARTSGQRMGEAAVALGYMSSDEVSLVRLQEARLTERKSNAGPVEEVATERSSRRDPRAVSSPTRAAIPPSKPVERKRPRAQEWQATDDASQGAVHVPRSVAPTTRSAPPPTPRGARPLHPSQPSLPGAVPSRRPTHPHSTGAREDPTEPIAHMHAIAVANAHIHASQVAANATTIGPPRMEPPSSVPAQRPSYEPSGFPLASGDEVAEIIIPPTSAPPPASPSGRVITLAASNAAASVVPAADFRAASAPPERQTAHGVAAPSVMPVAVSIPTPLPPKASPQRPSMQVGQGYLDKAIALAARQGASDLHVHSGMPLLVRVDGVLRPLSGGGVMQPEAAENVIAGVTTDEQWARLSQKGEVDFAYQLPGIGRFRVNVYRQQRGLDAVFRLIPERPRTLEELGLPARLGKLVDFRTGLVLCTGPAGCGKSSTLAALLSSLVENRAEHVLTIEDPVEFLIPPGQSLVNQRQVGAHTGSFTRALRAALREDPDVIAITDLRDRETMSLAISAAETGHLVLGSLHTGSAAQTILRIVGSFGPSEREQARVMLAESLRAILSQRLLPRADGPGRVPAFELMMVNTAVSSLIREDKTFQLPSVMQTGKAAGMVTLDDSIAELLQQRVISVETARRFAVRKDRF